MVLAHVFAVQTLTSLLAALIPPVAVAILLLAVGPLAFARDLRLLLFSALQVLL